MNQIKSIQLGVIAICIATVPLGLAQTPRTRTGGSNQTIIPTTAAPIYTGSNGNSTRATLPGINAGTALNMGTNPNVRAHTAANAGVQAAISNQATGITRAVTGNGGSRGATQTGINAPTGTNTTANTKAGAQTGTAAETRTVIDIVEPGSTPALILFTATPSPTPIPTPTPVPSPSVSPSPSPSP